MTITKIPTWTLQRFLRARERERGGTGELTELLMSISVASKIIAQLIATAGFKGLYGYTGEINSGGENTAVLDREADEILIQFLGSSGHFGLLVSEEQEAAIATESDVKEAKYVIAFDPVDGSSNIGSNIPVGTIFAIWRKKDLNRVAQIDDFMQVGRSIVAAGYVVYGAKASFVYSTGQGVHGFSLDPSIGEYLLTEEKIICPDKATYYSVNEANLQTFADPIKKYISEIQIPNEKGNPRCSARYSGSLVADFDRNLRKGGIFLYPGTAKHPRGKLRLLYEVAPLAFIAEQAGAAATDGSKPILDILPMDIHERAPFIVGSKSEVARYMNATKS